VKPETFMLKSKRNITVAIVCLALVAGYFLPASVYAAGLVPCGGPAEKPCTVLDAFYMIARVTNWLILMAGIYGVYQIVNHGFWLVASSGNEEDIVKHRKGITSAIVGFFIVTAAYMFVNTTVNAILMSKCKINFASPWTYITMTDPSSKTQCTNEYNVEGGIVPGK
jgi:hypothetical protein